MPTTEERLDAADSIARACPYLRQLSVAKPKPPPVSDTCGEGEWVWRPAPKPVGPWRKRFIRLAILMAGIFVGWFARGTVGTTIGMPPTTETRVVTIRCTPAVDVLKALKGNPETWWVLPEYHSRINHALEAEP